MRFHPELALAARVLPRGIGRAWLVRATRWVRIPAGQMPAGIRVVELALSRAKVRVIAPTSQKLRPAIIWIHGGGYVMGAAQQDDRMCAAFAQALDAVVVSVDYRLAPENPYPAALDDCMEAFDFVHREAGVLHVDPARVVIAGASAGGGLAAALTLRVHDEGKRAPVLQLLVYPMLDDRTRVVDGRMHRVWDQASNAFGWDAYLGTAAPTDHAVPARRVSFAGLPPAWIGVGTCDLFHDEAVAYAEKLRAAGVPVTLEVVDGAFHGFDAVLPTTNVSRAFFASQVKAIAAHI